MYEMKAIIKKHKIEKMVQSTQEAFALEKLEHVERLCDHLIKVDESVWPSNPAFSGF